MKMVLRGNFKVENFTFNVPPESAIRRHIDRGK